MLTFQPQDAARFSYRAEFTTEPFANISFYDDDRREILFHLSLRAEEGLAVCNRRGPEPGDWDRERPRRVALARDGVQVELRFTPPEVSVHVDGVRVFRFADGPLRKTPFPGLDRIAHADFQGGIRPTSIKIEIGNDADVPDGAALWLTRRLEIRGQPTLSGEMPGGLWLETGAGDRIEVIARPLPQAGRRRGASRPAVEYRAVLPGRVWQSVPEDAALELRLRQADGTPGNATLSLTRADMAATLEQALTADLRSDAFAAMQAVEHTRFAGLEPLLSAQARARLSEVADFFGLHGFLHPDTGTGADSAAQGPTAPAPAPDPDEEALKAAQLAFLTAIGNDPDADPLQVLRGIDLPPALRPMQFAMLAEFFCTQDAFEGLHWLAGELDLPPVMLKSETWHDSAVLPFLWMEGRIEELRDALWRLGDPTDDWLVTPSVAWVITKTLESHHLPEIRCEELIYGFMNLVDRRSWIYWGRTPCLALIRTAVRLLSARNRLADYLQDHVDSFALRSYGLSRQFWDMVAKAQAEGQLWLTPELYAAQTAFDTVRTRVETGAGTDEDVAEALALFDRAGNPEVPRLRRELLGPVEIPTDDSTGPHPAALRRAGIAPGEPMLRHLAFPGTPEGDEAMAKEAARALAASYPQVPRAPYYQLQRTVSRRANTLAARVAAPGSLPDEEEIDALAADLAVLASARSKFLGIGIALSLIDALLRADARDAAERLFDHVERMRAALPEEDLEPLSQAPAVLSALFALQRTAQDGGPALANRTLALFAGDTPQDPPRAPAQARRWPFASPVLNTIVTVFSCKPNLDTRVQAMREGWLQLLTRMGVPYVVIVGDGDGRQEGDVVHVDAPDDYEGLPQKTLATIRWVHDNTTFTHMLKIDDDCFLNADEFFHSQSYRKFDYYGRILTRHAGQMDRAWHCAKASSLRGQLELDKSPEPSTYADGGSGYTLSRKAMAAALEAADSPEGQHLVQVSFMEDKLLGDLLSLRGIQPADEDYRISVRRRTHAQAIPVSLWVNGFDASKAAPVKLVHLDTHLEQARSVELLESRALTPKKIWPSYQPATLGFNANALELVGPLDRLDRARQAEVALVACMRNEMFMLPHFLDHYRRLGVDSFLIADNCSDDGTLEYLAEQPDVALFSVDTEYRLSHYGVSWQQALLSAFRVGRWSLVADADEFLVWRDDGGGNLPDLLAGPDFAQAEAVRLFMLDMYPQGRLEDADFASGDPFAETGFVDRTPFLTNWPGKGPFSNMPTWTSALRHRLIPGSRPDLFVAQKIALMRYRPWMRLSAGLHFVGDVHLAQRELLFAHFKYNADFRRKARAEVSRRQHFNDAEEYRKYLALVSEGRDVIYDPDISVPWAACEFAKARLSAS